jgi:hypothetical protein
MEFFSSSEISFDAEREIDTLDRMQCKERGLLKGGRQRPNGVLVFALKQGAARRECRPKTKTRKTPGRYQISKEKRKKTQI